MCFRKQARTVPGEYERLTAVSVFDAATGEELFRIKSAFWSGNHLSRAPETFWLPDSSGLVVTTARGNRIVTAEGKWAPLPDTLRGRWFVPSPTEPLRFLLNYPTVAVLDEDGELVASVATEMERRSEEPPDSFLVRFPVVGSNQPRGVRGRLVSGAHIFHSPDHRPATGDRACTDRTASARSCRNEQAVPRCAGGTSDRIPDGDLP